MDPEQPTSTGERRRTYRHGDLRAALLSAGLDLARAGGPDAVVLREATRRSGVSPNAAYRHFADRAALLSAVSDAAQGLVADRMEAVLRDAGASSSGEEQARRRLRAVGTAYMGFAQEEPGLFRAAFTVPGDLREALSPAKAGLTGRTPFQILAGVLDELVDAGALAPGRREGGEFLAWSAVHGLASLVIDGRLRGLPAELIESSRERLLDLVERGL
ncbi:TetR/AcrR family transcriptional regulator [Naasia sp. SYSU D00948]|uniref:TetR/AcrR family transcriptional regulator n=1 Tax=Naasia sp. SYSU D00948 TaxID=2817379 RepID=UPI0027DC9457|nr:TetR/AcrR family transcriptional regulator [Naasia sp. SYSU D00948]